MGFTKVQNVVAVTMMVGMISYGEARIFIGMISYGEARIFIGVVR